MSSDVCKQPLSNCSEGLSPARGVRPLHPQTSVTSLRGWRNAWLGPECRAEGQLKLRCWEETALKASQSKTASTVWRCTRVACVRSAPALQRLIFPTAGPLHFLRDAECYDGQKPEFIIFTTVIAHQCWRNYLKSTEHPDPLTQLQPSGNMMLPV